MHIIFLFAGFVLVEGFATPTGFSLTKLEALPEKNNAVQNGKICLAIASTYGATYRKEGLPEDIKKAFVKKHARDLERAINAI